ncbi:MAG: hypothetical protein P1T08_10875 [Acidimicrobiia bacterium]|nr:hypothetical protein [Acidimicrobiia bacterium]
MPLTISIAAYFVVAATLWVVGRHIGRASSAVAAVPYIGQLALVAAHYLGDRSGFDERFDWIASLGVSFGLRSNDLTMVLTAIVAGVWLPVGPVRSSTPLRLGGSSCTSPVG